MTAERRNALKRQIDLHVRRCVDIAHTGVCRDCHGPRGENPKGRRCRGCYNAQRREYARQQSCSHCGGPRWRTDPRRRDPGGLCQSCHIELRMKSRKTRSREAVAA